MPTLTTKQPNFHPMEEDQAIGVELVQEDATNDANNTVGVSDDVRPWTVGTFHLKDKDIVSKVVWDFINERFSTKGRPLTEDDLSDLRSQISKSGIQERYPNPPADTEEIDVTNAGGK